MILNTNSIKRLNPCTDRLENWLHQVEQRDYTQNEFINLTEITHRDKMWVLIRQLTLSDRIKFARWCDANAKEYAAADYAAADYAANVDAYVAKGKEERKQLEYICTLIQEQEKS